MQAKGLCEDCCYCRYWAINKFIMILICFCELIQFLQKKLTKCRMYDIV